MKKKCNPGRKVIKIPAHMEKEAYLYAGQYVKNVLGVHERDPEFKQVVDKAAKRFLTDSYEHSLTPHTKLEQGGVAPNPYKVSETVPFAVDFTHVKQEISKFSAPEQKVRWATFYSSIASVVHSYLKLKFKWKADELDASGKPQTSMPVMDKGLSQKQREAIGHTVFRNRFIRQLTNIITVMVVDELFAVDGEAIAAVAESILNAYSPSDLLKRGANTTVLKAIVEQLGQIDFAGEVNDKLQEIAQNMQPLRAQPPEEPSAVADKEAMISDFGVSGQIQGFEDSGMVLVAGEKIDIVKKFLPPKFRKPAKSIRKKMDEQSLKFVLEGQKTVVDRVAKLCIQAGKISRMTDEEGFRAFLDRHPSVAFVFSQAAAGKAEIAVIDAVLASGEAVKANPRARETESKTRRAAKRRSRDFT